MSDEHWEWRGKSGAFYRYAVHELPYRPDPDSDGNYIFARFENGHWQAVYIGQGDLRDRYDGAFNDGCVTERGATHWHAHPQPDSALRKAEEADLIAGNIQCWAPNGCNVP